MGQDGQEEELEGAPGERDVLGVVVGEGIEDLAVVHDPGGAAGQPFLDLGGLGPGSVLVEGLGDSGLDVVDGVLSLEPRPVVDAELMLQGVDGPVVRILGRVQDAAVRSIGGSLRVAEMPVCVYVAGGSDDLGVVGTEGEGAGEGAQPAGAGVRASARASAGRVRRGRLETRGPPHWVRALILNVRVCHDNRRIPKAPGHSQFNSTRIGIGRGYTLDWPVRCMLGYSAEMHERQV